MSDETKDPPIVDVQFTYGRIVDFGDMRVTRGMSRRPRRQCEHGDLIYDQKERRIWCRACETDVDPFDAFVQTITRFNSGWNKVVRGWSQLQEAQKFTLRSRAAKNIDKAWRSKRGKPACPSCKEPLSFKDFGDGNFPRVINPQPLKEQSNA